MTLAPESDEERRLLAYFRALTDGDKGTFLMEMGQAAFSQAIGDRDVLDLAPIAFGIEPEKLDDYYDQANVGSMGYVVEIIRDGINATGEPFETLFYSDSFDEEYAKRFAYGAEQTAVEQGSFFNYDEEFAFAYIRAWRLAIARAIVSASRD